VEYRKGMCDSTIWVSDLNDSARSLLNDLDTVIPALIEEYGNLPIVYRCPFGRWHQLVHEGGICSAVERLPEDYDLLIR